MQSFDIARIKITKLAGRFVIQNSVQSFAIYFARAGVIPVHRLKRIYYRAAAVVRNGTKVAA